MALTKRLNASAILLDFLIWAILSLFGTRLFLEIFNNPIIGRGNWHIAHVLWGGLFMLVGIIISLIFYGKNSIHYASIFAGVGWGLFIDEIGKFITRDNNYWFRPAIIFIYISFVLLFFLYRILEKKTVPNRSSLWNELFEDCEELINNDLEKTEKKELLQKIKKLEKLSPSTAEKRILLDLKVLVKSTTPLKDKRHLNFSKLIAASLNITYTRLFKKTLVFYGLFAYSLWYIIDRLVDGINVLSNPNKLSVILAEYSRYDFLSKADVYMITLKFIFEIIVAAFFATGLIYWLRKKAVKGIKFYQWGLLINIFLGSVFKFYFEQFSGVFTLILSLLVWTWLDNYRRERSLFLNRRS